MITYTFWVDGACSGNPGPMGIGIVATCSNGVKVHSRDYARPKGPGTNNRAELLAVQDALLMVAEEHRATATVVIVTDSQYVHGLLTLPWKAKENVELVAKLRELTRKFKGLNVKWVRGHDKCVENHRADQLAVHGRQLPYLDGGSTA